jgi:3-deoxy-7-phosphoheptulonate synthase
MIITLEPDAPEGLVEQIMALAARHTGITPRQHAFRGESHTVIEIHLIGRDRSIESVSPATFEGIPGVRQVVRVSAKYRLIGRHAAESQTLGFEYNGVSFTDRAVNLFPGLCAVDTPENVEAIFSALQARQIRTARMGAYKPRTSPYEFQGLGSACLPWVFEAAGRHGIRVMAMEVLDARHIDEIRAALAQAGEPTGVMLQIGTRNAQNFELLKQVGQQKTFPVLFKRGMGISLEESLNACEYVASEGNPNIVFCLRGVKTHLGDPHRNLVDFAHVPVVRRQTRLTVGIDPSHSVGRPDLAPDGLPDIFHVIGQGVIAGATLVLVDFHPTPRDALCDGAQALLPCQLGQLVEYVRRVRQAYQDGCELFRPSEPVDPLSRG